METEASSSAGMQKRAKNLAVEEILIEVMIGSGQNCSVMQGVEHFITRKKKYS